MMNTLLEEIGTRIAHRRDELGITQSRLSEIIGIKRNKVAKWEIGLQDIKTKELLKIADALDISVDYLLGRTNLRNVYKDKSALIGDVEKLQSEIKKRSDALQQALGDARLYAEGIGLILHEFGQRKE